MSRDIILPGGDTLKLFDSAYPASEVEAILTKALRQPGRNLLRNARFDVLANIVNQRGVTGTISTPGYFIDGWKLISGSVTITAAGLVLNGTMVQILEQGLTLPFTASVLRSDGLLPAQYDNATKTFTITATGQTIIAAKLELGPNQTIAHQDADGNWVLNGPPQDFGLELEKCQRYYWRSKNSVGNYGTCCLRYLSGELGGGVLFTPIINVPVTMAAAPVVTLNGVAPGQITSIRSNLSGKMLTGSTPTNNSRFFATEDGLCYFALANTTGTLDKNSIYEAIIELNAEL